MTKNLILIIWVNKIYTQINLNAKYFLYLRCKYFRIPSIFLGPRVVRCYYTAEKKCGTGVTDTAGKKERMAKLLAKIIWSWKFKEPRLVKYNFFPCKLFWLIRIINKNLLNLKFIMINQIFKSIFLWINLINRNNSNLWERGKYKLTMNNNWKDK